MEQRVLVIGGSYFAGRVFNMLAAKETGFQVDVVNRGRFALNGLRGVTCYTCDRHDTLTLSRILPRVKYDAVVDFCAYEPGDVRLIVDALHDRIGQYILLSSVSVCDPSIIRKKNESDPVISQGTLPAGMVEEYLYHKAALEKECAHTCLSGGIPVTFVRPSFLYGPFNYAPRERLYIEKIVRGEEVWRVTDATARFSMLYVEDLARALIRMCGEKAAFNEIFHLAGPEAVCYSVFEKTLEDVCGRHVQWKPYSVREVLEQNIPVPYPLTDNDLSDGEKAERMLGIRYTPLAEGLRRTFEAFARVYG